MDVSETDRTLLAALQDGLPPTTRPYADIAAAVGLSESEVIARLESLRSHGVIKRFGLVVRHHENGYRANAMVTWNVPDALATEIGHRLAAFSFVTLCYRRARRLPAWPYNLYCMIHGKDRETVESAIRTLIADSGLAAYPHQVLFSRRRFKQRGAYFGPTETPAMKEAS
jgi:DNA-binding Lrp family transcriptional regulator